MIRQNLIANYIGQGWAAFINLAVIPVYIRYMGIESYALIGLLSVISAWLSLLDMGLTPTLGREMARLNGKTVNAVTIRDLLRSIEVITFAISLLIALASLLSADWISTTWLTAEELKTNDISQAFFIIGLVIAFRFAETIYQSSIIGLQKQVLLNLVISALATIRCVGSIIILAFVSTSIKVFFLFQLLNYGFSLLIFAFLVYNSLPPARRRARPSLASLSSVWQFAGGMLTITLLSLLLTQTDKVLLSKLLNLKGYGYYTFASTIGAGLFVLITPVTQSIYPRLCELHSKGLDKELANLFHKSSQLVSAIAGSATITVLLYSHQLLLLWTQDLNLSSQTAPILALILLGNLFNGLYWIPYQTQLAYGWTSLAIKLNIAMVTIFVPSILIITPRFGAIGTSLIWALLNLVYLCIGAPLMFSRILVTEKIYWYLKDLIYPLLSSATAATTIKLLFPRPQSALELVLVVLISLATSILVSLFCGSFLRGQVINFCQLSGVNIVKRK